MNKINKSPNIPDDLLLQDRIFEKENLKYYIILWNDKNGRDLQTVIQSSGPKEALKKFQSIYPEREWWGIKLSID